MITPFQQWLIDVEQAAYDNDLDIDLDDLWWLEAFNLDLTVSRALSEYMEMNQLSKKS